MRIGSYGEFVGRETRVNWLKEHLLKQSGGNVAITTALQGAGGMGKTFLAHHFAENEGAELNFEEFYLGETDMMSAGTRFLDKRGFDISKIDSLERLKEGFALFYQQGEGVLIMDDVQDESVKDLFPHTPKWRVLITTRFKDVAERLVGSSVRELDRFSEAEAMGLFEKVLGEKRFSQYAKEAFTTLAEFMAFRPYGLRLASASMRNSLSHLSPVRLLDYLKAGDPQQAFPGFIKVDGVYAKSGGSAGG